MYTHVARISESSGQIRLSIADGRGSVGAGRRGEVEVAVLAQGNTLLHHGRASAPLQVSRLVLPRVQNTGGVPRMQDCATQA